MADTNEKIISINEKKISSKGGNEEIIQRIIVKERDGSTYKMISDINKKKIKKSMLPQVIERMSWPKFGIVAGQSRGSLEPGIIATNSKKVIDPSYAWIIPTGAEKPVKIAFEGGTIVDEYTNYDRSKEVQIYKKVGVRAIFSNDICVYKNTSLKR